MGQSADAKLIFGVILGDEMPEWLAPHADEADDSIYAEIKQLEGTGLETFVYGYTDGESNLALGIELAWAMDFGYTTVNLEGVRVACEENKLKLEEMLKKLGAPKDLPASELHIIVSYG